MAKKSNFIKNLLTTASAVAVITGGASSAYAASLTTTGNNVVIGGVNTNLSAGFVNGDDVQVANAAHIAITTGNNITFGATNGGLDANGNGGVIFTIAHDVTFAGGNDFGTANGGLTGIVINAGTSSFGQDIAGDITINAGTLTVGRNIIAGNGNGDLLANGGTVAGVVDVARNVILTNGAIVNQTGTIGGNLDVGGSSRYLGAAGASDVAGTVIINTINVGTNTIHDVAGVVTLTKGNLDMHDANANVTVGINAGILNINDIAAGNDLIAQGGQTTIHDAGQDVTLTNGAIVNQTGTIGRNLNVAGNSQYKGAVAASNVAGTVIINTKNAAMNTIGNVAVGKSVTLTEGKLTMNDSASDVTVDNNANNVLVINDITAAHDLVAQGGQTTIRNAARDVTLTNGAIVNQTGTIGRNLSVANNALYVGAAATDVAGTVIINTTNAGINKIHNANGDVTVTAGTLTMNNTTGAANLIANGGVTNIVNAVRNVTLTGGAIVNQTGTIGQNLSVGGNALYVGEVGANVTGTVTINTANDGINTIHDATGAVRLTEGKLTMNNASADVTVDNKANNVLVINDIINGANLIASGGQTTVRNIAGNATLNNAAIVNVSGNIVGALTLTANTGTVNFTGKGTVTGAVGAGGAITKITVADTTTFADATFQAGELNFTQSNAKAVFNKLADFANVAKVTLADKSTGNIINFADDLNNVTGAINKGGDVNALTFLYTAANAKTLTVDTANFVASVKSNNNRNLNLDFTANTVGNVGSLGDATNALNVVNFKTANGVSVGNIYSKDIVVYDATQATFRGIVSSDSLKLGDGVNGGAAARFANGAEISSPITTNTVGKNNAYFEGDVTINKPITNLERVIFSNDESIAFLNADIKVSTVLARKTMLTAENNNVTISSNTTAQKLGANAGKTLSFNNGGVGIVNALKLEGDVCIGAIIDGTSGQPLAGKVVVEAGSPLEISTMTSAKVLVDDENSGAVALGSKLTIFDRQGAGVDLTTKFNNIEVEYTSDNNTLVKWVATADQSKVYLTSEDNSAAAANNLIAADATDKLNFQALAKDPGISGEMQAMNAQSQTELVQRMDPTDASAVVSDITTGISAGLGSRISSLVGAQSSSVQNKVVASNGTTGLSAGDDETRYGVWISPFFNQSVQKANKGSAGYTASTGGGSFGFDTKANDDMVVGLALSMLHSDVKYKNYKSGDKNKINSAMFSVYGMQQITDNWFGQGLITVGTSKVTTNEKRRVSNTGVSNTGYQNATGTYNSMSFSGEALVGYNYVMSEVSITPMGGLRVSTVSDDGYTETGTTNQNLSIARKALNKAELVVGARVGGPAYDLNGVSVTPEVHGFLNQDMIGKNAKVNIKTSNGTNVVDKSSKPNKTSFNVGAGLDAKYSYMEYGIAYDANISKKFMSNQGTIKVRLNF